MKRTTLELDKVWSRALHAALVILPLGLSGCFDDKLPPAGSFDLTVSVSGSGQVTSNPAGIDCGSDCVETLTAESIITLSVNPTSGAMFSGWGGDCSGSTPSCTLTMNAGHVVTASFTFSIDPPPPAAQHTLSVSMTGTGSVSSTPAGISCGADCTESYTDATSVTLTATPGTGFQFSSWSGACSGTGSCVVAMSEARSVSASFTPILRALTVTINGTGSVTSAPAGINCGTDCSENYTHGTSATLTAIPGTNQQFSGWLGACSSTTTTCTVAMTEARSVTAAFAPVQRSLTASVVGSGSVTSSPAGISCGTDCTESYDHGVLVTLSAVPVMGFQLAGWSGACTASTGICAVTMNATQSVTATFTASSGSAQLLWDAPTANADGSALADLAGYTLRYGSATGNYPQSIDLPLNVVTCSGTAPTTCSHTVNGLSAGTWYFTVQAYDRAGNISANSNEATRSVP